MRTQGNDSRDDVSAIFHHAAAGCAHVRRHEQNASTTQWRGIAVMSMCERNLRVAWLDEWEDFPSLPRHT